MYTYTNGITDKRCPQFKVFFLEAPLYATLMYPLDAPTYYLNVPMYMMCLHDVFPGEGAGQTQSQPTCQVVC